MRLTRFDPLIAAALLAGLIASPVAAQDGSLFDSEGYRTARYRTPIAIDPRPAPHVALAATLELDPAKDALFIDVMPVEGGVRDPETGDWQLSVEHLTIPGAEWHPETGRAPVDAVLWQGLRSSIDRARMRRPNMPVIVFCRVDCWMSWNAAKRLVREGVPGVWWLAEGTDGWHDAGRDLIVADPVRIATPTTDNIDH